MKFTKLFTIKLTDWQRALVVAVFTTPFTIIIQSLATNSFDFNWRAILAAGLSGGMAYILKNFLTNSSGQVLTSEDGKILNIVDTK